MPVDDDALEPESFDVEDGTFVPAFFARDAGEAEEYRELLSDHDIPARAGAIDEVIDKGDPEHRAASRRGMTHGVPVLVPESLLDEASEIIADREDFPDVEDVDEDDEEDDLELGVVDSADDEDAFIEDDEDDEDNEDGESLFAEGDDLADPDDEDEDEFY